MQVAEVERQRIMELMSEFDRSESAFYEIYGGGPARRYHLIHPDTCKTYPSAALAQAALGWPDINGGVSQHDSAVRVLERAGFQVIDTQSLAQQYEAELNALTPTERLQIVAVRIGQDLLRRKLMGRAGRSCEITGIKDESLLRASHIKPWKLADDRERLDPDNGILLSALWDSAFDGGLVTFKKHGAPKFSKALSGDARETLQASRTDDLQVGVRRAEYLNFHRDNIFKC